jgi:hypothetical protein
MSPKTKAIQPNKFVRPRPAKPPERQSKPSAATPRRRAKQAGSGRGYRPESLLLPIEPRPAPRRRALEPVYKKPPSKGKKKPPRQRYDIAFSLGRAEVHAPGLSLPHPGPRWISGGITALLAFLLYTMWNASLFTVGGAELIGNQRLGSVEIDAALRLVGEPVFLAVPGQIEANLRATYLDLEAVDVHVRFPNKIVVEVVERTPVLAWYQDGALAWLDVHGIAFPPRGAVEGLIPVSASGTPPQAPSGMETPFYERPFIDPQMVQAMLALSGYLPAGVPMIFDPQYGMGWQDPRGWMIYFGQNTAEIPMKLATYQAIVETLTAREIQPTLISVEYLDAPFYK